MDGFDITAEDVPFTPEDTEAVLGTEEMPEPVRTMETEGLTGDDLTGFTYITEVPDSNELTEYDVYILQVKQYNLSLLALWTIIGMFVIYRVFEAFKPAYKVSKE